MPLARNFCLLKQDEALKIVTDLLAKLFVTDQLAKWKKLARKEEGTIVGRGELTSDLQPYLPPALQ